MIQLDDDSDDASIDQWVEDMSNLSLSRQSYLEEHEAQQEYFDEDAEDLFEEDPWGNLIPPDPPSRPAVRKFKRIQSTTNKGRY